MMIKEKTPPIPAEKSDSVRQKIINLLQEEDYSAKELSAEAHIPEKEVYDHLSHIKKSIGHLNLHLAIQPAVCQKCGFNFVKRDKLTKPGKCPSCRNEQITSPRFEIKKSN